MNAVDERFEESKKYSRGQLRTAVKRLAGYLRTIGVQKDAVIAAYAANCYEVVVYALAAACVGAIFTSISADFGVEAVIDRIKQTSPIVLLASTSVVYNGKVHSQVGKINEILKGPLSK